MSASSQVVHSEDPVAQKAWVLLFGERPHDAIHYLKSQGDPESLGVTAGAALVSAYRLAGRADKAEALCWTLTRSGRAEPMEQWLLGFELACLYAQKGRIQDALGLYQDLLNQVPNHPRCLGNMHQIALSICDWSARDQLADRLLQIARDPQSFGRLYAYLALHKFTICDDPAANLAVNRLRSQQLIASSCRATPKSLQGARRDGRLRIGYLGEPFRDHARAHLLTGVLESHDRDQVHVSAFGTGPSDGSDARARIEQGVDEFFDCYGLSDEALTARLIEQGLDVLVVTDGWNHGHRMAALASHPVPVQIGYLGNPCTSGTEFIDYIIVDDRIAQMGDDMHYSEALIRLSGTYQATDNKQPLPDAAPRQAGRDKQREQHGLPADGIVFASFNQTYKFTPDTISLWFSILRDVPGSVLWLLDSVPEARGMLARLAEQAGLDASRLVFAPKMDKQSHINRLALADICLDPLICNGHTTTTDALWAGVPVVARYGQHFASRVAASVLHAAGAGELVCASAEQYHKRAIELAKDPDALAIWRQRLADGRANSRLFNTAHHTRLLEEAYKKAHERSQAGKPPVAITIG